MNITHNGNEYELNVDKAIKDGYLVKTHNIPPFTRAGDVFHSEVSKNMVIVMKAHSDDSFYLAGVSNNPLAAYNTCERSSIHEIRLYLIQNNRVYLGNVAEVFARAFTAFLETTPIKH